jgi:hypothetical protein
MASFRVERTFQAFDLGRGEFETALPRSASLEVLDIAGIERETVQVFEPGRI